MTNKYLFPIFQSSQDDINYDDTSVLYSDEEEIEPSSQVPSIQEVHHDQLPPHELSYSKASCSNILKGVFSKLPERDEMAKLLTKKFLVPSKNLTHLNFIQIMEIMTRKLIHAKYVKINEGAKAGQELKKRTLAF